MEFKQEPDRISVKAVLVAALITVVVSAAYITAAWVFTPAVDPDVTSPWLVIPEEVNQHEVARFDEPTAAERLSAAAAERLIQYGWVDEDEGVVHIPIEQAIEVYLDRQEER